MRRFKGTQVEFDYIITPDGESYTLHNFANRFLMSFTGYGMPPIEYKTQRGPFQHGETVLDYFLRPRTLTLVHRRNACSRADYWDAREDLINHLRPNRAAVPNNQVTLRKILPNGNQRDIDALIQQGPTFTARDPATWDEWTLNESLQFVANDPTFYDPTQAQVNLGLTVITELVFPFEYDVVTPTGMIFGGSFLDDSANITYGGTWLTYPTIEIDGPITNPSIENQSTGEVIQLSYTVSLGETVTINLTYGNKTVSNGAGDDLIGTVTTDSDLATFHLEVDPLVAGGVNTIHATGGGCDPANTEIRFNYYTRYIAI